METPKSDPTGMIVAGFFVGTMMSAGSVGVIAAGAYENKAELATAITFLIIGIVAFFAALIALVATRGTK